MNAQSDKKILAIDTSCDDTSVALTSGRTVMSNVIASQTQLHKQYGGVFPTVAKLAHAENIGPTIRAALRQARCSESDVDAVAVTVGPGLAPALEIGIRAAEDWAEKHQVPVLAVNHLEGHLLSVFAQPQQRRAKPNLTKDIDPALPALGLLISGGHTQLILVEKIGSYQVIGSTLDDAAGECLDKIGRMVNLGYPAGATIEELAKTGNAAAVAFPLPLTHQKNFDFSFSGLKTFARNYLESIDEKQRHSPQFIRDFCASAQFGVFRHVLYKTSRALSEHPEVRRLWLGGGVAANMELRRLLRQALRELDKKQPHATGERRKLLVPYSKKLCADNAAMIGIAAARQMAQKKSIAITAAKLERIPRLKIDTVSRV